MPPAQPPTPRVRPEGGLLRSWPGRSAFSPGELILAVSARGPRPRERLRRPGLWRILTGLLRDGGILNAREAPWRWRWLALIGALMYQGLWCLGLVWLMYVRFLFIPLAAPGEGNAANGVIEVTWVDAVEAPQPPAQSWPIPLPDPQPAPLPPPLPEPRVELSPEPLAQSRPALPALPVPPTPPTPPAPPPLPPLPEPQPEPTPSTPLMVTEVEEPDSTFVLHVPEFQRPPAPVLVPPAAAETERTLPIAEIPLLQHREPSLSPPQLQPADVDMIAAERPLPIREIPASLPELELPPVPVPTTPVVDLAHNQREILEREIPAPLPELELQPVPVPSTPAVELVHDQREILEREIPAPLPELELQPVPVPSTPTVELAHSQREIHEREIPLPLPEPELRPLAPAIEMPSVETTRHMREISQREIALTPAAPVTMVAPPADLSTSAHPPGEIDLTPPTSSRTSPPVRGDAWDIPPQDASGLLDASGRPRLADGPGGRAGGGLPPGTLVEDYANIDRMGTWLKRPVPGYQPGPLDQLWIPHENILEEWVRRSIKNIWIPIPGTGKVIRCTVVLLMLGGGCGITDPNLLDIETSAHPPPEIPFKPELHENQHSLQSAPETPATSPRNDDPDPDSDPATLPGV